MSWIAEPMVGFDLETTGTDVETDRVVTAAMVKVERGGTLLEERTWLLDPGIPIPKQASSVHGISTDHARTHGSQAATAIGEIAHAVAEVLRSGTPLVVMNARYDLTLLDRECLRNEVDSVSERLKKIPDPVIDPMVLDKHVDKSRRGRRTLQALCAHYGVRLDNAHNASADAVAAVRVARCIGEKYTFLGEMVPADMNVLQMKAAVEQSASLQEYLRRSSNPTAVVESAWPIIPRQAK
ncbi:3'-5' exonuclease [Streptomyces sp. NPDC088731]|uniref:3'-5' exonuclease n=1 Tax=Streptomyces sp. NPDC088731 TaxID=3365878 RepID=UPI0037FAD9C6